MNLKTEPLSGQFRAGCWRQVQTSTLRQQEESHPEFLAQHLRKSREIRNDVAVKRFVWERGVIDPQTAPGVIDSKSSNFSGPELHQPNIPAVWLSRYVVFTRPYALSLLFSLGMELSARFAPLRSCAGDGKTVSGKVSHK